MGNCQDEMTHDQFQFKRKNIFQYQNGKENLPPKLREFEGDLKRNYAACVNKRGGVNKEDKKESDVTYHLSNSLIQVKLSALNEQEKLSKFDLPILISKDTDISSSDKDSEHQNNISVDDIIRELQTSQPLQSESSSGHRKSIQISKPLKQSDSYIKKQQLRMKYTKSFYVDDPENQIIKIE